MINKDDPWAPFAPTAADPWDLRQAAHLHRRAGFGATWAELQRDVKDSPAVSVERLFKPRELTTDEKTSLESVERGALESRDAERLKAWWLYRILFDNDPLREKLTLFWHGHFATSNRKVQSLTYMHQQNETLRRHALGEVGDLLTDVIADPAMLIWLDGANSKKEKPNENFAREFLELFTLGVGHYTEKDIREAARAFTGWVRNRENNRFHHDPAQFDDGEKTFLKQTGKWKPADIVRITLEQPACAEFLCRKLYRYFVSDSAEPGPELIRPLAEELRSHRYSIRHVVGIILRSRHFYAKANWFQRIKSPIEYSVGLIRALEVPRSDVSLLALAVTCERQGQELLYPPNVKGWDGGKSWLNSTTLLERGNWANDLVWGNPDLGLKPYNPLAWARRHGVAPEKATEVLIDLLLQGELAPKAREPILKAGSGNNDGSVRKAVGHAQPVGLAVIAGSLRKALQLILHCPEYQLA
jgi:uncharacterized protein (DUF1800 family)